MVAKNDHRALREDVMSLRKQSVVNRCPSRKLRGVMDSAAERKYHALLEGVCSNCKQWLAAKWKYHVLLEEGVYSNRKPGVTAAENHQALPSEEDSNRKQGFAAEENRHACRV